MKLSVQRTQSKETAKANRIEAKGFIRFRVIGLTFLAVAICYMDRTNLSIAIIPMAEEFDWDKTTMGIVLSSFFFGYFATQILGGWLADHFGGKLVLGIGVLVWSLFTLLTAPAAILFGVFGIVVARIGMGLGEGITFPAVYSLFSQWAPVTERARSVAFAMSGVQTGTIAALLITPPIVVYLGWEAAFYLFGLIGIVWWFFWHYMATSAPHEHSRISADELALIQSGTQPQGERLSLKLPLREMLSHSAVWALVVSYFCSNWVSYVFLAWFPTYVYEELGVELASVGFIAVGPPILGVIGMNCAAWIADSLIRRGIPIIVVRKIMNTVGVGTSASLLFSIGFVTSAPVAIGLMCVSAFFTAASMSGIGANPLDIAPRHAGTLMGIANTIASIPGIVGVAVTGMILDATGSWTMVFCSAGLIAGFGMVTFLIFGSGKRHFE